MGTLMVILAALFAVLERHNIDPGLAGLSITYALSGTGVLNWCVVAVVRVVRCCGC